MGWLAKLARQLSRGARPRVQRRYRRGGIDWAGARPSTARRGQGLWLSPNEYTLQLRLGQPEDWPSRVPRQFAPSGRLIAPEEIATAAIYWLSDESVPISGSVVELEQ